MASSVAIGNRALTKVGEARIQSLSDDLEAARVISAAWDILRDDELRAHNWGFAMTRASLAALVSAPDWGFDRQFQLPSDCLRVVQVGEYWPGPSLTDYRGSADLMYRIERGKILTDLSAPLKIRYVARIEDTGSWDSAFVEAFACRLAMEIAERITQSTSKRELAYGEYKRALSMAHRANAIEKPPEPLADDTWILSRL